MKNLFFAATIAIALCSCSTSKTAKSPILFKTKNAVYFKANALHFAKRAAAKEAREKNKVLMTKN